MEILLANNVDLEQTAQNLASDLGLHCLPMTLLRVTTYAKALILQPSWREKRINILLNIKALQTYIVDIFYS